MEICNKKIAEMSFEDSLAELERIVRKLEDGGSKLDEAIDIYTRGIALKRHCESKLAEAKTHIEIIVSDSDGNAVSTKQYSTS
ncbi:MAG: exodeoxyribonuclease VII small subunit [Rhodospirillaceae bacterium]|jgi:exodeoxyribonuclease VII small subunit|nr:exodeoxyribonuclease VII small subunit [Rhodospirillaceae bacterium]